MKYNKAIIYNIIRYSYALGLFFFVFSCKDTNRDKMRHLVKEWEGKRIFFPENMIFTYYGVDTLNHQIPICDYTIVVYVDSTGCISCKLQLQRWKDIINEFDSLSNEKINYLFIFHPNDKKELKYLLKRDEFSIPVFIDEDDRFNKLNKLPKNDLLHVFLLDKQNRISIIGNPMFNIKLKNLYRRIIGDEIVQNNVE